MGLLSSRTFRQVALGAAGRYQEKRQTMRDRIDEYRERALAEKEKIQTKYNESYAEEKDKVNAFKFVATKVGQSYLPQLNSFAASGGDLVALQSMNIDEVRSNLDGYKPIEDNYLGGSEDRLKLKSEELNQDLQDQVGLFKGTSTLFTRDLEKQGMKDIQATAGTIDTGAPIDTRVSVGEGMTGTNNFVGQNKLIKNLQEFNTTYRKQKEDAAGRLLTKDDGSPDYDIFLPVETESILSNAREVVQNGFPGSLDLAIGAVMENLDNPDYDLPFLIEAVEGSPIDVELTEMFNQFKEREATKQMQNTIDEFRERGLVAKADNLQQELDDIITKKTDESETVEETTTTTEQPTGDIPGTKTERKGKSVSITTEDYISPEQKDANSKIEVTDNFIKQVMEKNDVNRNKAIDILKMYGYTQFPQVKKPTGPTFLKGKKVNMGQERLNALREELGIKKEQPSLPQQSSILTSTSTTITTSKPKSRLDSLREEANKTTITGTISQNPTFKDDFVNDMDPSTPEEVNNKYSYAFKLGLADTFRGIKQIAGKDKEEMKAEQRKLNELMRGKDGGLVTAAYFGGALLDPAGWLIPFGKAKTLYTMGKYGLVSGAVAGATGYVDDESIIDTRGKQLLAGAVGGGVVAPAIGGLRNLGVKITGKGEVTPVGFKRADLTPSEMVERGGSTVQVKGKAINEDENLRKGKVYAEEDRTLGVRPEGEIGREPTSIFDTLVKIFRKKDVTVPFPKTQKVLDAPKQGELSAKPQWWLNKLLKGYEENYGKRFLKVATTGEGGTSLVGGLAGFSADPEAPLFDVNAPLSSRFGYAFLGAVGGYGLIKGLRKGKKTKIYGEDTDEPVEISESYAEILGRGIIDKYGLSKDYKKLLQKYDGTKNDIASAFVRIAKQMQKLTTDERKILYNMLEGDVKYKVASKKLQELSKNSRDLITQTGQIYKDLGLIGEETFQKNRNRYIGRLYKKGDEPLQLKQIGDDLRPRGTLHETTVGDWFRKYKNQKPTVNDIVEPGHKGWELLGDFEEIGGQLYKVTKRQKPTITDERIGRRGEVIEKELLARDELVPIRWELTKEQRLAKGEIEDAAISMEYTGMLMANTVAKYQFYADVAAQFAEKAKGRTAQQMLKLPQKYRKIPDNKIEGTVSKRYGALAGKYVPEDVYKDIMGTKRYQEKSSSAFYKNYKKLNSLWKVSKTAWNPTVHVNNVFGNIVLTDLADVPLRTLPKALRALRTHGKDGYRSESVLLAIKHGVFDADFVNKEIKNFKTGELAGIYKSKSNADEWDNAVSFASNIYAKVRNNSITSKLEDWYRIEDHVFRLNAFMHRMKIGDSAEDAAMFARRQFIDYDIDAPLINHLRNTATPFLSFTYRLVPLLAESAILRPTKYAKYIAAGYGLNKMSELYGGEDAKVERALLPDYEAGNILDLPLMPKKVIRLPIKSKDGVSKYLNISRFYPGGDILSFEGDNVVPILPEPLQPSFGIGGDFLFSMIGYDIFRKQKEFGRGGGTALEETTKALGSFSKKLIPNFPFIPGSYSTKRLERALKGDVSKFREPQTELEALLTSFGFKVSNKSIRTLGASQRLEYERQVRVQKSKLNQLKNRVASNQITMADYDRQVGKILAKINKLTNKFVGRFDGIDPYSMTFDFDMTKFMGRGDKATIPDKDYD